MLSVSKTEFKKEFKKLFNEVETHGEDLIVTENDLPLVIIQPASRGPEVEEIFGDIQGHVVYSHNVFE